MFGVSGFNRWWRVIKFSFFDKREGLRESLRWREEILCWCWFDLWACYYFLVRRYCNQCLLLILRTLLWYWWCILLFVFHQVSILGSSIDDFGALLGGELVFWEKSFVCSMFLPRLLEQDDDLAGGRHVVYIFLYKPTCQKNPQLVL